MESLKNGVWFPEMIVYDLVSAGLSPKSVGADIMDKTGKRFFYDKVPFALVAWKQKEYAIIAFAPEFQDDTMKLVVDAFSKVMEYRPFVRYECFQQGEDFHVYEWAKDSAAKMVDLMALPQTKNIVKLG